MATNKHDSGVLADLRSHTSDPEAGPDRNFGIVFAVVFSIIGCWSWFKGGKLYYGALPIAAVFLLLAFAAPRTLAPLNRLWTKFGLLLGRIIGPIMLLVVYVVAVAPTGLLMRLAGKDPLNRRFDRNARSYWVHRTPPGKPDETMARQF